MSDPFVGILAEMKELHDKKSSDYGSDEDPLNNVRASEKFGIPAWVGAILRGYDKIVRIQAFVRKGKLESESVEDSLLDLAVYSVIALQMYRERKNASSNHSGSSSGVAEKEIPA